MDYSGIPILSKNVNYAFNARGALGGIGTNLIGSDATATTNVLNSLPIAALARYVA